jgi:hypothetical protein
MSGAVSSVNNRSSAQSSDKITGERLGIAISRTAERLAWYFADLITITVGSHQYSFDEKAKPGLGLCQASVVFDQHRQMKSAGK